MIRWVRKDDRRSENTAGGVAPFLDDGKVAIVLLVFDHARLRIANTLGLQSYIDVIVVLEMRRIVKVKAHDLE